MSTNIADLFTDGEIVKKIQTKLPKYFRLLISKVKEQEKLEWKLVLLEKE